MRLECCHDIMLKDKTILVDDAELELKKYPNAKVGL
jgi:hypothetical protein